MPIQIEVGIILPKRTSGGLMHLLPKARIGHESVFDDFLEPMDIERRFEHHHAGNHHQIGRALHSQPGIVNPAHWHLF